MKSIFTVLFTFIVFGLHAQKDSVPSIKSILMEQLKTTHNVKDWFVPASLAVQDLTADQANWKDRSDNHSIAQLTTHLIFWNKQLLEKFKGVKPAPFDGNNKETFTTVDKTTWQATVKRLDSVLTKWERDKKLLAWYSNIAHIGTHNAYHTGQILYIRKMKGWWDEKNGVK